MIPKINPAHKRRVPKRSARGNFSVETRQAIYDRDEGMCRNCGYAGGEIHHVKFKSAGGRGVYTNGLLVCQPCHRKIHDHKILANKWRFLFEQEYGPDYFKDNYDEQQD